MTTCLRCPRPSVDILRLPDLDLRVPVCGTHRYQLRSLSFGWPMRHAIPGSGWRVAGDLTYMEWYPPSDRTVCGLLIEALDRESVAAGKWEVDCPDCRASVLSQGSES